MAFSSSSDLKLTAGDIITEALELIGVLAEGESASNAMNTSALRTLNNIIKTWSADTQIFAQAEYQLDLVADTASYSLGAANVGYIPHRVIRATLINTTDNNEIPIRELTTNEYYSLTDKTAGSRPTQFWQKRNVVGVDHEIVFWPVPDDTTYDAKLWLQYVYQDVDATTDDVWFTQEWYLALTFQLAYLLSHKYGLPSRDRAMLREDAMEFYLTASSFDTEGSMYLQPESKNG